MSYAHICCRKPFIYAVTLLISLIYYQCSSSENSELKSSSNKLEQQVSSEIAEEGPLENSISEENLGCEGDMGESSCPDCSALGYETCHKCKGRGVLHCPSCDGDGWDINGRACVNCKKSGLIECDINQTCRMCGGNRYGIYITCETCKGSGSITLDDGRQIICGGGDHIDINSFTTALVMGLYDLRANTGLPGQTYCNGTGIVFRVRD